jgi:hypothetical protein
MTNPSSPPSPNSSAPKTPAGASPPTDATTSPPKTPNKPRVKKPKSAAAKKKKIKKPNQAIIRRIIASAENANEVIQAFKDNPADTYHALLKTIGQIAFDESIKSQNQKKKIDRAAIREFARIAIAARREEVSAQKINLDREKWEFDVAKMCLDHLKELQAITVDSSLAEDARLHAIRHQLFGPNLPK